MVETGDEDIDYADRLAASADVAKNAWAETIEEAQAIAEELESDGWETLYVPASSSGPEGPEAGVEGRFGIVHVVPGNKADEFREFFEAGAYPRYEVFRNDAAGHEFLVTTLYDPDSGRAIVIVGSYQLRDAANLVSAAMEEGKMYTHVRKLDGTHLGSFEHDDPETFFPHADRLRNMHREGVSARPDEEADGGDDPGDDE